jgi:Tol biopolymer transport system component
VSTRDRLEHRLPSRLEELAAPRTPSYFDDVIHQTARTRQRPGWSFPERWLPVSVLTDRLATAPRAPMRAVAIAALLLLALAAIILVAGGSRQSAVPAPFGVAGNGRIAWLDASGAIVTARVGEASPSVLVPGPEIQQFAFSPDGTRLAFVRPGRIGMDVVVSAADGSDAVVVSTGRPVAGVVWAPDSRSLVLENNGTLSRVEAREGATPTVLAKGVTDSFERNVTPAMLFRPPTGDQLAYLRSTTAGPAIAIANADGSNPRDILSPATAGLAFTGLGNLQWSPDGTRLAVTVTQSADGSDTRVYVLNADGTGFRRVTTLERPDSSIGENNSQWSPDGRSIAMQVWFNDLQPPTQPITVADVATGATRAVGSVSIDGFMSWGWSPDAASIIVVPASGRISLIDVATGQPHSDRWQAAAGVDWQRVAPPAP